MTLAEVLTLVALAIVALLAYKLGYRAGFRKGLAVAIPQLNWQQNMPPMCKLLDPFLGAFGQAAPKEDKSGAAELEEK